MDKTLLLIEDNLEVRENTAEILELAGYKVLTAENGKEGVRMAQEAIPRLIICDIMMPELDGYGVLHILSKNPKTASIPFIFLTAKAEKSDFRKGMNLGADDYIIKPFDEVDLMNTIESRLKKSALLSQQFVPSVAKTSHQTGEQLELLSSNRKSKPYKKKETIYREGDFPNYIYCLTSGKVKTIKINDDGKEYVTGLFSAGDFLGYESVLREVDYTETAVTLEESEVCMIPKNDFVELIQNNRELSSLFIKMLSKNIIEKEQQLLDLAYNTVRKRVADALVKLCEKYKTEDSNFKMAISRSDLASMVGTATESVIRILSEFKEDGYVKIEGSTINVLQLEKLKNIKY